MKKKIEQNIYLDGDDFANFYNLISGLYSPMKSFFGKNNYKNFIEKKNQNFLPILLNVEKDFIFEKGAKTKLIFNKKKIGEIKNEEIYKIDKKKLINSIFGFNTSIHPIIKKIKKKSNLYLSGKLSCDDVKISQGLIKLKARYKNKFKRSVAFSSRNIPHFGHELIIKNLIKKKFKNIFIIYINSELNKINFKLFKKSYQILSKKFDINFNLINLFLPSFKAGPKEALFQAQILRNIGIKNFSIGRDHAGILNFYKKYETQDFLKKKRLKNFNFIFNSEPVMCSKCKKIFFRDESNKNNTKCHKNKLITFSGNHNNILIKQKKLYQLKKYVDKDIVEFIKYENF